MRHTPDDLEFFLERLTAPPHVPRANALLELTENPIADRGLAEALAAHLTDATPEILYVPITVGERRFAAALALAAVREALGERGELTVEAALPHAVGEVLLLARARWGDAVYGWPPTECYRKLVEVGDIEVAPRTIPIGPRSA